jgi:predicted HTH domain antitoxin
MSIVISEDLLYSTHLSEGEMKQEIAVMLFEKDKLTLGPAARFAEMSQWRFQHLLANRAISRMVRRTHPTLTVVSPN